MNLYLLVGIFIFFFSAYWGFRDLRKGLLFFILFLPLNHKKTLSFLYWNLTPPRVYLVGLLFGAFLSLLPFSSPFDKSEGGEIKIGKSRFFGSSFPDLSGGLKRILEDKFFLALLTLWLVRAVSLVNSKNITASLNHLAFFSGVVALYVLFKVVYQKHGKNFLERVKDIYLKVGLVVGAFGIVQLALFLTRGTVFLAIWPVEEGLARVGSTFWDVNHFAAYAASLGLLFLGRYFSGEKLGFAKGPANSPKPGFKTGLPLRSAWAKGGPKARLFSLAGQLNFLAFLFMSALVLLTASQSGLALLTVGTLVALFFFWLRGYRKRSVVIISAAAAAGLVFGGYFFQLGLKGETNLREELKVNFTMHDDSVAAHVHLAEGAWQIFQKYPLIGGGYGSFNSHFRETPVIDKYLERDPIGEKSIPTHSIWFGSLSETGVLGLAALLFLILYPIGLAFKNLFQAETRQQFVPAVVQAGVILGIAVAGLVYTYNLLFFWFLLFFVVFWVRDINEALAEKPVWACVWSWFWRHREALAVIFLIVFSGVFIFWRLGRNALIPWDEGIYAGVSREVLERKDPWTLYWNKGTFFEKPPLFFWLQACSFVFWDFKPFGARLPAALFGILGVIGTYLLGKKLFSKRVGFFAGLFLATTIHWVAWSRTAMLDVPAAVLILFSLYFFWGKRWILFGVFLGLTFMMKGPVAVVPAVVAITFLAVNGLFCLVFERARQPQISNDEFLISNWEIGNWFLIRIIRLIRSIRSIIVPFLLTAFFFLLITFPWHYFMIAKHGEPFVEEYFGYHMLKRASQGIEMHGRPFWWFNIVIRHWARHWYVVGLVGLVVLVVMVLGSLLDLISRHSGSNPESGGGCFFRQILNHVQDDGNLPGTLGKKRKERSAEVFLLLWLLLTFFIFSASESKIQWYIMPIYPPLALLCGWFVDIFQRWLRYFVGFAKRRINHKSKAPSSKQIPNSKLQNSGSSKCGIFNFLTSSRLGRGRVLFVISGARFLYTLLASLLILVMGTGGLLYWLRMWFPENLNKQVAELSDYVWRIRGPEKKFYVADTPPPLPIFYSGLKVTTVTEDGIKGALKKNNVSVLSKKGTYREVVKDLQKDGGKPLIVFKETEDYILYGY